MLLTDQKIPVQQLPLLSRVVALLGPIFPDITSLCLAGLEADFARLLVRKMNAMSASNDSQYAKYPFVNCSDLVRLSSASLYQTPQELPSTVHMSRVTIRVKHRLDYMLVI